MSESQSHSSISLPLPKCPKDGADMAPCFSLTHTHTNQITKWKCVFCLREVNAFD